MVNCRKIVFIYCTLLRYSIAYIFQQAAAQAEIARAAAAGQMTQAQAAIANAQVAQQLGLAQSEERKSKNTQNTIIIVGLGVLVVGGLLGGAALFANR